MGRLATAEELASLVIYLASDEVVFQCLFTVFVMTCYPVLVTFQSAFVTGSEFKIDGGWSL